MFERVSKHVGFRKWYLFPIPLIMLYALTSVVPHLYSLNTDVSWKIHYDNFADTAGWLILIIAVSYGTVIFRGKYVSELGNLVRDGIISTDSDKRVTRQDDIHKIYVNQIRALLDKRIFIAFLILFEILVGFFWYFDIYDNGEFGLTKSTFVLQIPATIIMIFVLPVAAEVFTAATSGALLPYRLKDNIVVNPLHFDHHGGLKPFGNIMLIMEYVYVGGLAISFLAFEEFRNTPILFLLFIIIVTGFIFAPQKILYHRLSGAKKCALEEIQKVYFQNPRPDSSSNIILPKWKKSIEQWPFDASYLTFVKMAKDEVELMKTLSFDIITLYKIAAVLISLNILSSLQEVQNLFRLP